MGFEWFRLLCQWCCPAGLPLLQAEVHSVLTHKHFLTRQISFLYIILQFKTLTKTNNFWLNRRIKKNKIKIQCPIFPECGNHRCSHTQPAVPVMHGKPGSLQQQWAGMCWETKAAATLEKLLVGGLPVLPWPLARTVLGWLLTLKSPWVFQKSSPWQFHNLFLPGMSRLG